MDSSIRVLLVDEDVDVLAVTRQFLEREDAAFEVETATSAAAALDSVREGSVDAVITDYRMPETDGVSLAEAIRDREPTMPVVLFTARQGDEIEGEVDDAGLTGYVRKRTGTDQYAELAAAVRGAVSDE